MAKNKEGIVSVALRLFIICFVSTLILAFVNMLTKEKIEENNSLAFKESCEAVMATPSFRTLTFRRTAKMWRARLPRIQAETLSASA